MIDISRLRQDQHLVAALLKKDPLFDVQKLLTLEKNYKDISAEVEALRSLKNELAQQAKSGVTNDLRQKSLELGNALKIKEEEQEKAHELFMQLAYACPNIALDDVPEGGKEQNKVVAEYGQKPVFSFPVKHHLELGTLNQWFDFEKGAQIASSQFVWYNQEGVRVLYALAFFMLKNNMKHGFSVQLPPLLANEETLTVSGNFPKFKEEVFSVTADGLYAIPTAEVSLVNKYRNAIIDGQDLPICMTAWTSCFRREAGNYGKMERGLIRIHQFEKVELVTICKPEQSEQEFEKMLVCSQDILQQLGLHYRVSLLAGQDCSFQSAKTYDIEVWLPGQNTYYEVSSLSNCTDFQARRGKIRYREAAGQKTILTHTLNASSLALPRLMVALMENYQQSDGSIVIPKVLEPYLL